MLCSLSRIAMRWLFEIEMCCPLCEREFSKKVAISRRFSSYSKEKKLLIKFVNQSSVKVRHSALCVCVSKLFHNWCGEHKHPCAWYYRCQTRLGSQPSQVFTFLPRTLWLPGAAMTLTSWVKTALHFSPPLPV